MQKKVEVSNFVGIMMKRYLTASIAAAAFLFSGAQTFEAGGLFFEVTAEGECQLIASPSGYYSGEIDVPSAAVWEGHEYAVTGVDAYAFDNCTALTAVSLPVSVKSVGRNAFYRCGALESFSGRGVEAVGSSAFSGCASLQNLLLGNSLAYIGDSGFRNCTALVSIEVPLDTEIGLNVFSGCTSLRRVKLPSSLTAIPAYTFSGCTSLEGVEGLDSVVEFGDYAFGNCSALENISVSRPLEAIGSHAFSMCASLEIDTIRGNGLSIASFAFEGCSALRNLSLLGVTEIGEEAFGNCEALDSLIFDESMRNIRDRAFKNCEAISYVSSAALQPPFMSTHSFADAVYENAWLEVGPGLALLYRQSPPWSLFEHIIETSGIDEILDSRAPIGITTEGLSAKVAGPNGHLEIFSVDGVRVVSMEKSDEEVSMLLPYPGLYVAVLNGIGVKFICR